VMIYHDFNHGRYNEHVRDADLQSQIPLVD
jgi:hypothetical protein